MNSLMMQFFWLICATYLLYQFLNTLSLILSVYYLFRTESLFPLVPYFALTLCLGDMHLLNIECVLYKLPAQKTFSLELAPTWFSGLLIALLGASFIFQATKLIWNR